MKIIGAIFILTGAYLLYVSMTNEPDPVPIEEEDSQWCFYAEVNKEDWEENIARPPHAFIKLNGRKLEIFVPCDTLDPVP